MYKVILVDDDPYVLEDIKNIVDWNALGFKIIACAKNGLEAMTIIKRNLPDLIISDVEMYDVNGLELLKRNKKYKSIVTVFISAYDNFSYAREAIRLGAFDYLLKPVVKEELLDVLKRSCEEIEKRRAEINNAVKLTFFNYLNDYIENGEKGTTLFKLLGDTAFSAQNKEFVVGIIKSRNRLVDLGKQLKNTSEDFYCASLGSKRYAFLYVLEKSSDELGDLVSKLSNIAKENDALIGISKLFNENEDLVLAINQANVASCQNFITEEQSGVYLYDNENISELCIKIGKIESKKEMQDFLKGFSAELIYYKINVEGLSEVYAALLKQLSLFDVCIESLPEKSYRYLIETYDSISSLVSFLNESMELAEDNLKTSNALINEVLKYISENYNSRILIQDIARKLNINSNYLSILFKNECGKSYTSYLIDLRLKKAEELLRGTKLTLYEICEAVGYDDYFHFSKIFKKYKGLSPANYRKNLTQTKEK